MKAKLIGWGEMTEAGTESAAADFFPSGNENIDGDSASRLK